MVLLVSACLLGLRCRYDGQSKRMDGLERLLALPGWGGAKRLALIHSLQIAAFPAGPLDIPMHGYATEKELIWL